MDSGVLIVGGLLYLLVYLAAVAVFEILRARRRD